MGLIRFLTCAFLAVSLVACAADDDLTNMLVDDTIQVSAQLVGPRGEVLPFTVDHTSSEVVYRSSSLFRKGWVREEGTSLVSYISALTESASVGRVSCVEAGDGEPQTFTRLPTVPDIYVEFVTALEGNTDCFLDENGVLETIRLGPYSIGTNPGEVQVALNADTDGFINREFASLSGGTLMITEVDYFSAEVIGVPGVYYSFTVDGLRVQEAGSSVEYVVDGLNGRMFASF